MPTNKTILIDQKISTESLDTAARMDSHQEIPIKSSIRTKQRTLEFLRSEKAILRLLDKTFWKKELLMSEKESHR